MRHHFEPDIRLLFKLLEDHKGRFTLEEKYKLIDLIQKLKLIIEKDRKDENDATNHRNARHT